METGSVSFQRHCRAERLAPSIPCRPRRSRKREVAAPSLHSSKILGICHFSNHQPKRCSELDWLEATRVIDLKRRGLLDPFCQQPSNPQRITTQPSTNRCVARLESGVVSLEAESADRERFIVLWIFTRRVLWCDTDNESAVGEQTGGASVLDL